MPSPDDKKTNPACAGCTIDVSNRICMTRDGSAARGCPSLNRKALLADANREYDDPGVHHFAKMASLQEAECYANRDQTPYVMQPSKTRIVETCEFAQKMAYRKIGLAFCIGLAREAGTVAQIFEGYGFETASVCCKAGQTSKDLIGLTEDEKIFKGTDESMCNPIFQARLLDQAGCDFNVLLGLCVGHDTLFLQYSQTPATVLAVKDRVTGHNPLAAIYNADSYYKKIRYPDIG